MNNSTTSLRPTLAVAMIVKNEAKVIEQCLESIAKLVDEIVILDSGSTDDTEAIARRYTDKFYVQSDWPGFGRQRQIAQNYVKSDWILWLDADEVVTPELAASIREALDKNESHIVYKLDRLNWYFDRFVRYGSANPDFVTRLYPTTLTHYNDKLVHESVIIPEGTKQVKLKGHLLHYTFSSYYEHLKKSIAYAEAWAEQRAKAGETSSIAKAIVKSLGRILRDYILRRGFLDGRAGVVITVLSMQSVFNKYAMLHYKSKEKRSNENPPN
ncbi:glycosyltransferase family 2 protein [Oligella ureolytica]|jgi:(heptosyl)LPS beta-1,4-glucosyltransferase